jgi:hypothetical protein
MDSLPTELTAHILQFLDTKSLVQISRVSSLLKILATDKLQWIKCCLTEPRCKPLVQAAMLEKDLLNENIDAKALYKSIKENEVEVIRDLLFPNQAKAREFALYAPYYEPIIPTFFPRSCTNTRRIYLTEEAAKKNTLNAEKVKHWLKVQVTVEKDNFVTLYTTQSIQSAHTTSKLPVLPQSRMALT